MLNQEQIQPSLPAASEAASSVENSAAGESDNQLAETMRLAFEEISASSSRIVQSLERLNALAQETYCELDATRRTLSSHH